MTSVGSILPFDTLLSLAMDERITGWLFLEFSSFSEDLEPIYLNVVGAKLDSKTERKLEYAHLLQQAKFFPFFTVAQPFPNNKKHHLGKDWHLLGHTMCQMLSPVRFILPFWCCRCLWPVCVLLLGYIYIFKWSAFILSRRWRKA